MLFSEIQQHSTLSAEKFTHPEVFHERKDGPSKTGEDLAYLNRA